MQTTYTYKEQTYSNLYELSEALGKDGVFIPLSISDDNLAELGVTVTHEEEPIENVKQRKIMELKRRRDTAEVEPVKYGGQGEGASIDWTTADNQDVKVTANDLRCVIAAVAVRSNALHTAYRAAKEKVEAAQNKADIEKITM